MNEWPKIEGPMCPCRDLWPGHGPVRMLAVFFNHVLRWACPACEYEMLFRDGGRAP